jgi:spore germination protein KB
VRPSNFPPVVRDRLMTPGQAQALLFLFILGTAILIIPTIITSHAQQDAWLSVLLAALVACPAPLMTLSLCRKHRGQTVVGACLSVMGPYAGTVLGAGFVFYGFYLSIHVTKNVGMFMTMMLQPETPFWPFHLLILTVAVYAYRLGPEVLGRFGQLLLIIVLVVFTFTFLFLIGKLHPEFLFPVLDGGWRRLVAGAYPVVGFPFLETLVVCGWILPQIQEPPGFRRKMMATYFLGAVAVSLVILFTLMVFGAEWTAHLSFPLYSLAQEAGIADVIERIEPLTLIAWIACVQIKLILCFAFVLDGICTLVRVPNTHLLSIPLAVAILLFAEKEIPSEVHLIENVNLYWTPYSALFGLLAPLLLLAVTWIRGLGKGKSGAQEEE